MLESLATLTEIARGMMLAEFVRAHPEPFLFVSPFEPADESNFRTNAVSGGSGTFVRTVARIRKREGANVFASMVTLGRAQNNDIRIPATTVSKFHCYFTSSPTGMVLSDAGSTNGTFHNGNKLEPRSGRVALKSGDEVRLGELKAVYLDARAAWERLRSPESPTPGTPIPGPALSRWLGSEDQTPHPPRRSNDGR